MFEPMARTVFWFFACSCSEAPHKPYRSLGTQFGFLIFPKQEIPLLELGTLFLDKKDHCVRHFSSSVSVSQNGLYNRFPQPVRQSWFDCRARLGKYDFVGYVDRGNWGESVALRKLSNGVYFHTRLGICCTPSSPNETFCHDSFW